MRFVEVAAAQRAIIQSYLTALGIPQETVQQSLDQWQRLWPVDFSESAMPIELSNSLPPLAGAGTVTQEFALTAAVPMALATLLRWAVGGVSDTAGAFPSMNGASMTALSGSVAGLLSDASRRLEAAVAARNRDLNDPQELTLLGLRCFDDAFRAALGNESFRKVLLETLSSVVVSPREGQRHTLQERIDELQREVDRLRIESGVADDAKPDEGG